MPDRQIPNYSGNQFLPTFDRNPNECPMCHFSIDPRFAGGACTDRDDSTAQLVFQCPRDQCRSFFVAVYHQDYRTLRYELGRTFPRVPIQQTFGEEISTVSPTFVEVYNQALASEASGLDQIAGMGLRKALEFLIKDFAVYENPGDADEIKKTLLGSVIKKYISDPNVQRTATRATWLGNDETHYVRRWEDRDVTDLKLLIRLTVNWVENILLTQKYEKEMPA